MLYFALYGNQAYWRGRQPSSCKDEALYALALQIDSDEIFFQGDSTWILNGGAVGIDLKPSLIENEFGHQVAIETAWQLAMCGNRACADAPCGYCRVSHPCDQQSRRVVSPSNALMIDKWN